MPDDKSESNPSVIVHGGAGSAIRDRDRKQAVEEALHEVRDALHDELADGMSAREAVVEGCRRLEDDPHFNAGTGSVLQSDGRIRLSASMMGSDEGVFSGVVNAENLQNPIDLADALQDEEDHVVAAEGAQRLMRELETPMYDPMTEKRLVEWLKQRKRDFEADMANVVSKSTDQPEDRGDDDEPAHGTVGVVALDGQGRIAAGTSTGGRGFERVGRVSDSAMPAGNYTTEEAAISCTGIGEDIIDECAAARIAIRVTDGESLRAAFEQSFREASDRDRSFAAVGIDARGNLAWGKTTEILLAAWHDGLRTGDTLNRTDGQLVESRQHRATP